MPEWFVFMVRSHSDRDLWVVATLDGAVMVCGKHDLDAGSPVIGWSMDSTVEARALMSHRVVTEKS